MLRYVVLVYLNIIIQCVYKLYAVYNTTNYGKVLYVIHAFVYVIVWNSICLIIINYNICVQFT